jgi:hypothetical protein
MKRSLNLISTGRTMAASILTLSIAIIVTLFLFGEAGYEKKAVTLI